MTAVTLAVVLALSARAEEWVRELGGPSFPEREQAQARLLALGGPALPAVTRASASPDPEVARRARGLVKDIGYRLDCQRLLAGTPVRLEFTNAPLADVLTSLSKQSGYALGVTKPAAELGATTVSVRTGEVPFWKAVEEVGRVAGLTVAGLDPDASGARFFVPEVPAAPTTPGERVAAWQAEVEGLIRFGGLIDAQARGVLTAYRIDLRHYADAVKAIEAATGGKNADPAAAGAVDRMVRQAENIHTAARNLFTVAGVRVPIGPNGRYPVVLAPITGPTGSASAGIWVEPSTAPPAVPLLAKSYVTPSGRPTPAPTGPTVLLRVVPEPRIDWVRTTGIRIEHAVDDQGRAAVADLTTAPRPGSNYDDVVFLGGGRVVRSMTVDGTVARAHPYYASVLLKSELPHPTTLREFRGAVLGVVRAASREVVAQPLTIGPAAVGPGVVADRRDLLRFSREPVPQSGNPTLAATMTPVSDRYILSVYLTYSGGQYSVAVRDAMNPTQQRMVQEVMVGNGAGGILVEATRSPNGMADRIHGLRVTDAAGKPFQLTGGVDLSAMSPDGSGATKIHLTLTASKTDGTSGPPVRIAWHASRLAAVEVPFDLANVPVVK